MSEASRQVSETASRPIAVAAPDWAFAMAISLAAAAVAPAWLKAHGQGVAGAAIFAFFSKLCHQHAERSLVLFGSPIAVCLRCLGIYIGAAMGSLVRLDARIAIRFLMAAFACNLLDVAAESIGFHGDMPLSRLLIGGMLGIAAGAMFAARQDIADSPAG